MCPPKILLGQLSARGDCLYATAVARQIKYDYPGCHLTWAIGSMCKSVIDNNPYVDEVWEIDLPNHSEAAAVWRAFEKTAKILKQTGVFDEVFLTQISPNNVQNFDGTVRASIFRGYPHPITVPISPIIRLNACEIQNVQNFVELHSLKNYSHVILFEYSSNSGQSFVTTDFAIEVSKKIIDATKDACIILSSNKPIDPQNKPLDYRIIDGSILSFRENAELIKYCTLLIGCSSGISWLCTAEGIPSIPKIQLLRQRQSVFASMIHDFEYFGFSTENIMEMTECLPQKVFECFSCITLKGFAEAKLKFQDKIPLNFDFYFDFMSGAIAQLKFKKYAQSMQNTIKRYGVRPQFVRSFFTAIPKNIKRLFLPVIVKNIKCLYNRK